MNTFLSIETLQQLKNIQTELKADSNYIPPKLWPDRCDDCSGGSCSGGCSYVMS